MIKIFFEYKQPIKNYWNLVTTINCPSKSLLDLLIESFNKGNGHIVTESDENTVYVQDMLSLENEQCPTLKIDKNNYQKIINVWNININNPAPYLILSQDDSGWITLEAKQELSQGDLDVIEQDKRKAEKQNAF